MAEEAQEERPRQSMANSSVIELCILSDATISMGPYMKQVKEDISKIINESRCQFGIDAFRIAFVAYRDWIGDGERLETLPFTTNITTFEDFVSHLKAEGGDDAAEDVLGGLQTAINLNWTAQIKILYHICDAPPHGTMYHDLYDRHTAKIDSVLSTIDKMMAMENDSKDMSDSDSSSEEDIDANNLSFIQSKTKYKLTEKERNKLDRFPNKHAKDPNHNHLLQVIKDKNIQYCIGAKTAHVDKFIDIMIDDGNSIDLNIQRMEIASINNLFPSVLRSIEYALRIVETKSDRNEPKIFRPMTISRKGNFKVHCGIDFGTDGSAISLLLPQSGTVAIHQWGSGQEHTKTKTNILINPKTGKVLAFGTDAAIKYNQMMENRDTQSSNDGSDSYDSDEAHQRKNNNAPMFFEHFKMALYKSANDESAVMIEEDSKDSKENKEENEGKIDIAEFIRAVGGRTYESMKVLEAALRFMKGRVMSIVNKKPYCIKDINEIQWILTVPAIWTDRAKYIMERCADKAGMINFKENIENHLLIAYEPDCASISIRHSYSDLTKKYNKQSKNSAKIFEKGDIYLLCDLGGGTADFATHEIIDDCHVKQIRSPSGGPWGSSYIDKEFEKLLRQIFKKKWIEKFERKYPEKYVQLLRSFRFKKEKFKFGLDLTSHRYDSNEYRNNIEVFTMSADAFMDFSSQYKATEEKKWHKIPVPLDFVDEIGKCIDQDLRRLLKRGSDDSDSENMEESEYVKTHCESCRVSGKYKHLVKFSDRTLYLEESVFRYLFDCVITKIVAHCKYLLQEIDDIKYICLVGGFSESKYLQSKLFYEFGPSSPFKKKILTPKRPILCVVDGAARYGVRPDYITSRTVSKTYGVSIQKSLYQFVKLYPDIQVKDEQIVTMNDTQWINNCFFPIVRKNDVIRIDDEPKVFHFANADENANKIIIKLYESNDINPVFTNGKNSELCATKELELPNGWKQELSTKNNAIPVKFFFADSTIRVFVDLDCIDDSEKEIRLDFDAKMN